MIIYVKLDFEPWETMSNYVKLRIVTLVVWFVRLLTGKDAHASSPILLQIGDKWRWKTPICFDELPMNMWQNIADSFHSNPDPPQWHSFSILMCQFKYGVIPITMTQKNPFKSREDPNLSSWKNPIYKRFQHKKTLLFFSKHLRSSWQQAGHQPTILTLADSATHFLFHQVWQEYVGNHPRRRYSKVYGT